MGDGTWFDKTKTRFGLQIMNLCYVTFLGVPFFRGVGGINLLQVNNINSATCKPNPVVLFKCYLDELTLLPVAPVGTVTYLEGARQPGV